MTSTHNIARSLTTRMNRKISDADTAAHGLMSRAFSTRKPQEKVPFRPEISLPVELLSATNPLAFTAPDIHPQTNPGSAISASTTKMPYSPAQTLASTASSGSLRSENSVPALSTSSSVVSPSPLQTPVNESAEQDFGSDKRLTTLTEIESEASIAARLQESLEVKPEQDEDKIAVEAPVIPKRAPSHTKKAHQGLHRQRSLSRIGARSPSVGGPRRSGDKSITETDSRKSSSSALSTSNQSTESLEKDENGVKVVRNSADIFASGTDHPFGAELAKLDEMAEEFSPTKDKHTRDAEPKRELRRERSFKALRRGLSRKEKKQPEPEKSEIESDASALQRSRSFKVLRRDPSTKELKSEPEPEAEVEAEATPEAQPEASTGLQRQRSFKVLRRDPSTKELKPAGEAAVPKLEKASEPIQEQIATSRRESSREPSRRRATTVTRDEQPALPAPRTPSRTRTARQRLAKVAVPPSEPTIWDEESEYLNKHGLKMYSAEDYITEIGSPYASTFSSSQSRWL